MRYRSGFEVLRFRRIAGIRVLLLRGLGFRFFADDVKVVRLVQISVSGPRL